MLVSVQYVRAIAALLVVFAHLSGFAAFQAISTVHFGSFGVDLFFIVSGFIMWETSRNQSPAEFMHRRIARIVPPYWFYTTVLVFLAIFLPRTTPNIVLDTKALLGSYLFIPYTDHRGIMNPILLQGWTLNFEMYFYLVFAASLLIPSPRLRFFGVAAFFTLSVLCGFFADKTWAIVSQITNSILMEFVLGMLVSVIWRKWKVSPVAALTVIIVATALLVTADIQQPHADLRFIVFGVPSALLLFGLLNCEPYLSRKPRRLLVETGNAS